MKSNNDSTDNNAEAEANAAAADKQCTEEELAEIQAELEKHDVVNSALVVEWEKDKLVAFVATGVDNNTWNEEVEKDLLSLLRSDNCSLSSHMVPWKILAVDSFPLRDDMVDREALLRKAGYSLSRNDCLPS